MSFDNISDKNKNDKGTMAIVVIVAAAAAVVVVVVVVSSLLAFPAISDMHSSSPH
jgi:hypothetical protein